MWNGDLEHVIDVIPNFTKSDIENQWNQARQLEDVMVAEIFDSSVCVCVAVTGVLMVICKLV